LINGGCVRTDFRSLARFALAVLPLVSACVTKRVRQDERPPVVVEPPRRPPADTAKPPEQPDIPRDAAPRLRVEGARDVRVALATAAQGAVLSATGPWRLFDARDAVLVRGRADEPWTVERRGRQLRAVRTGSGATPWVDAQLTLRPDRDDVFGVFTGRRYRGSLRVVASDTGMVIANVLPVEEYLRGVVPLEIGLRTPNEQAAVEAQAIAARSYTFVRLAAVEGTASRNQSFDLLPGVADQVYGGVDAERPFSDRAIEATAGMVLKYAGRVVSAPYSSSCGGETASPEEVWRTGAEPYLRRVSDRIPGSADRYYCDIAPRFAWTRTFSGDELDAAVRSYLRSYATVPSGGPGRVRSVAIVARTPSGRVGRLSLETERGTFELRGNDIRYVLRPPGGELLNSTYFTVEPETRRDGSLARLMVHGNGYGHGVGMCQWGAIGRARAGQSVRTILATYYPGTTVGPAN
jgi:stage II sporulation protein D (peptidoglycan lytic transglycosylase)